MNARTLVLRFGLGFAATGSCARQPPATEAPRPADRGDNGLWMRRVWLHEPHTEAQVAALVGNLRLRGIGQIYPFLGPLGAEGRPGWRDGETVRPYDPQIAAAFFTAVHATHPSVVVLPWSGGVNPRDVQLGDPAFRARFAAAMAEIVALGADGVQINVEPMPTGNADYLLLLDAVRAAIGPQAVLSVAAYPPTTPLHDYPDVHWDLPYLAEVCRHADELAVMAYDTAQTDQNTYAGLVRDWTLQLAETLPLPEAGGCAWRMGLPAYEDDEPWHRPEVETLEVALRGVRQAMLQRNMPAGFRGVALYASWTLDPAEWLAYDTEGRGVAPVDAPPIDETPAP